MYVIAGLGNPGIEYEATRHNVGFMVIDKLAQMHSIKLGLKSHAARWGQGKISGQSVTLVKPMTYMNESGRAISAILKEKELDHDQLIVVYDDMDLDPGRIRIRVNGGSGGHKGIKSIIGQLADENFTRVRIGIGRPSGRQDPSDYVLSPFSKKEQEEIEFAIVKAADAIEYIISYGVEKAMNEFNRRDDGSAD